MQPFGGISLSSSNKDVDKYIISAVDYRGACYIAGGVMGEGRDGTILMFIV